MTRALALSMLLFVAGGAMLGRHLSVPASNRAAPAGADALVVSRADSTVSREFDQRAADDGPAVVPSTDEPSEPVAATAAAYRDWARRDAPAFLTALPDIAAAGNESLTLGDETGERSGDTSSVGAVRLASEADPWLALEIAETIGGDFGAAVQAAALEAIAALDPEPALAYIGDIRPRNLRERLFAAVAAGFARHDLDASVDWWLTLSDRDKAFARYPIVAAVAGVDLVRAIDLDEQVFGRYNPGRTSAWLIAGLESGRQNPSPVASRLAGTQSTRLLADTMGWWVHRDTYGAIGWVMSQETVSATAVERMAGTLTEKDSQSALALAAQFPPAVRARWIETVVGTLANYDPNAALDVLTRFENEPFHAEALSNVAVAIAATAGSEAAANLVGSDPSMPTALAIVDDWSDPQRAADWAIAIEDSSVRRLALVSALENWARTDAATARIWVDGIRDDDLRSSMASVLCAKDTTCTAR